MSNPRFPARLLDPVRSLLKVPSKIVITTHHRPDGDAMGSSLGLYHWLVSQGHTVRVVAPSDYPDFLQWLPGNDQVLQFTREPEQCIEHFNAAAIIFCLDFNWMSRVEQMEPVLRGAAAVKVLIDHHLDPEPAFDHIFSYPEACSTSELIYQFIVSLGGRDQVSKASAECLYCGIMTDTNSFRYESMRSDTHRIIADLMDAGAVNYRIHELVYDNFTENRLRLMGYVLKDKLTVLHEYRTAYIALSAEEHAMFNFRTGDTEGLVNYALSIQGIRMAAFFAEREGMIKISFRSKDTFSVKELASAHFNGGGHRNASGGRSDLSLQSTVEKFLALLPLYQAKLLSE